MSDAHEPEPILPLLAYGPRWSLRQSARLFKTPSQSCRFAAAWSVSLSWAMARLDVHRGGDRQARGVQGWLRFRAWSCSSASPIARASSWFSR